MKKMMIGICTFLIVIGCLISGSSVIAEEKLSVSLSPTAWFGKTMNELEKELLAAGYQADSGNGTGFLADIVRKYGNQALCPAEVSLWMDSDTKQISWVGLGFQKSPAMFSQICQSMTLVFGEPTFVESREDKQERVVVTYPEAYVWEGDSVEYNLLGQNRSEKVLGTIEDAQKGITGFTLRIFEKHPEAPTPNPTVKPKPTATPKPVNVQVSVNSVEIKDTRYGTREFYIRFKNNGKVTVDRIDFLVIGYNRYGERIDYYGSNTFSFYTDEELKPGKTKPQDYYYTQSALNEATKIKIAIEKYHTTDGKTVTVPEYQLKWSTYTK